MTVRVRYAPSPSGTLHVGGARTALFNYLFARHHGGRFILRIEDTDKARQVEGSEVQMMQGLKNLGIQWDEGPDVGGDFGPYRQSERIAGHRAAARDLLAQGKVYPCFCTPEELDAERKLLQSRGLPPRYSGRCRTLSTAQAADWMASKPHVLRLRVPNQGTTVVHDLIRGDVVFENAQLDDFVIMKPDGTAIYNFAVVLDDAGMAISHVIRGDEHLSNTPKQILVAEALGIGGPQFAHVPMILAPDHTKLSKRHGAISVEEYRQQGILPEALVNYLMLLGWSNPSGAEFMTLAEAIEPFDLNRVQHTAAIYDQKKLEWMNGQYLRSVSLSRLEEAIRPFIEQAGIDCAHGPKLHAALELTRERARTLVELVENLRFLYQPPQHFDAKGVDRHFRDDAVAGRLERLAAELDASISWDHDGLVLLFDRLAQAEGVKRAAIIHPTRLALTGKTVGPGLFELMVVLGKQESTDRLRAIVYALRSPQGVPLTPLPGSA